MCSSWIVFGRAVQFPWQCLAGEKFCLGRRVDVFTSKFISPKLTPQGDSPLVINAPFVILAENAYPSTGKADQKKKKKKKKNERQKAI